MIRACRALPPRGGRRQWPPVLRFVRPGYPCVRRGPGPSATRKRGQSSAPAIRAHQYAGSPAAAAARVGREPRSGSSRTRHGQPPPQRGGHRICASLNIIFGLGQSLVERCTIDFALKVGGVALRGFWLCHQPLLCAPGSVSGGRRPDPARGVHRVAGKGRIEMREASPRQKPRFRGMDGSNWSSFPVRVVPGVRRATAAHRGAHSPDLRISPAMVSPSAVRRVAVIFPITRPRPRGFSRAADPPGVEPGRRWPQRQRHGPAPKTIPTTARPSSKATMIGAESQTQRPTSAASRSSVAVRAADAVDHRGCAAMARQEDSGQPRPSRRRRNDRGAAARRR